MQRLGPAVNISQIEALLARVLIAAVQNNSLVAASAKNVGSTASSPTANPPAHSDPGLLSSKPHYGSLMPAIIIDSQPGKYVIENMRADSVRRKRKKRMNKHKHRKRLKLNRHSK